MRISRFAALFSFLALLGCADTARWQSGDACTQISKNAEEIRNLEDRIARLQADGSSADPMRQTEVARLEERRRDLQRNNTQLVGSCSPSLGLGSQTDYDERRRERLSEPR